MRKHGGTPSRRDKHVTLAAISPPSVARGRFVGGQQSGLAGSKPPPLFTRGASSCSSQGRRQGEPWGASPRPSAPTYLPGRSRGSGRSSNKSLPAGTDVLRRTQPTTSHRTSRHHSKSRTALAILTTKLCTATQARRLHDPQNTARYGARQAGRHEHEQRTTELEQHPGAPMGSTGTRQGGPTGPCHRRGVYI